MEELILIVNDMSKDPLCTMTDVIKVIRGDKQLTRLMLDLYNSLYYKRDEHRVETLNLGMVKFGIRQSVEMLNRYMLFLNSEQAFVKMLVYEQWFFNRAISLKKRLSNAEITKFNEITYCGLSNDVREEKDQISHSNYIAKEYGDIPSSSDMILSDISFEESKVKIDELIKIYKSRVH